MIIQWLKGMPQTKRTVDFEISNRNDVTETSMAPLAARVELENRPGGPSRGDGVVDADGMFGHWRAGVMRSTRYGAIRALGC